MIFVEPDWTNGQRVTVLNIPCSIDEPCIYVSEIIARGVTSFNFFSTIKNTIFNHFYSYMAPKQKKSSSQAKGKRPRVNPEPEVPPNPEHFHPNHPF